MSDNVRDELRQTRELARRARRLAMAMTGVADRDRLLAHAAELDAKAEALEGDDIPMSPPAGAVVQVQMQVQQQQSHAVEAAPLDKPEGPKPSG